ncbi:MAG: DUF5695 domain-containing protein [Polyangiaceae bacterium]
MRSFTVGSYSLVAFVVLACSGSDDGSSGAAGVGGAVSGGNGNMGGATATGSGAVTGGRNGGTGVASAGAGVSRGGANNVGGGASTAGNGATVGGVGTGGATASGTLPGGASSSGGAATVGGNAGSGGASGGATTVGPIPDTPWITGSCGTSTSTLNFETAEFCVSLSKTSQIVTALKPKSVANFDFTPADLAASRSGAGYFHLGDITLRLRQGTSGEWQNVTTSSNRSQVTTQAVSGDVKAAADLTPVLPSNLPLTITRSWGLEGGRLVLRFELKNKSTSTVQIGALGLPMVFNNVITNRSLDQAHATCSFANPYIGNDAGYVQVTRLSGQGPALLVVPDGKTPFEAYNPILNAPKTGSKESGRGVHRSDATWADLRGVPRVDGTQQGLC